MIQQLVARWRPLANPSTDAQAAADVITADPLDLILHMEQVWNVANVWAPNAAPAGPARTALINLGRFAGAVPAAGVPAWDHLGYAFAIENTRAPQIFARVVRAFRSGEALGVASIATQRWLDITETVLLGAGNPVAAWLSTSAVRPDPEAVRRNAYYRLFGMDLAHGTEGNAPYPYEKADAANRNFGPVFEELLNELWRAIENIRNVSGANTTDDDRIFRLAEQLGYMLRTRRQNSNLAREELAAAAAMGWVEHTLLSNTPVIVDMRADAASAGDRLRLMGERVGLAPHSRANAFFSMASDLSLLLRALEGNWVKGADTAWVLYATAQPPNAGPLPAGAQPLGNDTRRVITEWSAASGRDLKRRALPVSVVTPNTRSLVRR